MVIRRPMLARVAAFSCLATLATLLAACEPDLRDGVYGCKTGACPDGFYCHTDDRCYAEPETEPGPGPDRDAEVPDDAAMPGTDGGAGGEGGMNGDAGTSDAGHDAGMDAGPAGDDAAVPYEPCTSSATCDDGLDCLFGPDSMADDGYCSETCVNDFSCPMLDGRPGLCIDGECFPACDAPGQCGGDYGCYSVAAGPFGANVCTEITDADLSGTRSCQVSGTPPMPVNCDAPAVCLFHGMFDADNGICSLHCESGGGPAETECPGGGRCVEAFEGITHCLAPCTSQADCGAGLICAPFGPGSDLCIPAGWSDQSPPLPPPGPPM